MKRRTRLVVVVMAVGAGVALVACNGKEKAEAAAKAEQARVEVRAQELAGKLAVDLENQRRVDDAARKANEEKAERERVTKTPQDFFETSALRIDDQVDAKHLMAVHALSVTNKSRFLVAQLDVRVDFRKDGQLVASVPLKLKGSLPAGGTRAFSVEDQTLEGAAVQAKSADARAVVQGITLEAGADAQASLGTHP